MTARGPVGGAVAGVGATLIMEYAAPWLNEREEPQARAREEQLCSEMPTTVLVRDGRGAAWP